MKRFAHQRFEAKLGTDPKTGCTIWLGAKKNNGTGLFVMHTWNPRVCISAQRYAYQFYVGPIPPNYYVKARCGNPLCVTQRCLRLKSHADVIKQSVRAGRWVQSLRRNLPPVASGFDNPNAKYTNEFVAAIKKDRSRGDKLIVISHRHKIPVSSVGFICSKRMG